MVKPPETEAQEKIEKRKGAPDAKGDVQYGKQSTICEETTVTKPIETFPMPFTLSFPSRLSFFFSFFFLFLFFDA